MYFVSLTSPVIRNWCQVCNRIWVASLGISMNRFYYNVTADVIYDCDTLSSIFTFEKLLGTFWKLCLPFYIVKGWYIKTAYQHLNYFYFVVHIYQWFGLQFFFVAGI